MVLRDIWSQKCQLLRVVCHWRGQESISSIGRSMPCDPSSIVIYINSEAKEAFTQVVSTVLQISKKKNHKVSSSVRHLTITKFQENCNKLSELKVKKKF